MLGGYLKYSITNLKIRLLISFQRESTLKLFQIFFKQSPLFLIIYFYLYQVPSFPQEYQITNVPVEQYSIDRYTNEIYYRNDFTGDIFKTNFTGIYHTLTEFPTVPQFSNNSHTAAFMENNNLYLHDFGMDTSYFLGALPYFSYYLLFSPSDTKIVYGGDAGVPIVYFSFEDSSVHNTGITIYDDVMQWLNDTTIVYISLGGIDIRVLNINDLSNNILVPEANLVSIRGLANNTEIGAFAYGYDYNQTENAFVNLYFNQTGLDTNVYNFLEQGPGQEDYTILIRSLTWEKNTNKLAFIGAAPLQYLSLIYVFDSSSFMTNLYSNPNTNGDGFKYHLQWLNQDTVIYSDYYDGGFLFGLDVTTPVSVKDKLIEEVDRFDVKVFPNPFNNATKITIYIPSLGELTVELYSCLGESIGRKSYNYVSEGKFTFDWDEIQNNKNLSAGIYFIRTLFNNKEYSLQKTIKVVYLK